MESSFARESEHHDDHHHLDDDRVLDWVPKSFVPDEVHHFVANKRSGEGPDSAKLSEFDLAGPAVLYGFRSLCPWAFALVICLIAYHNIGNFDARTRRNAHDWSGDTEHGKDGTAFMSYPLWLWLLFLPMAFFIWHVQMHCLSYTILPQVKMLGRGFNVLGQSIPFQLWRCYAFVISVATIMDVTSQCLFYAQFLRSVERTPEISQVWKVTTMASFEHYVPGFSSIVLLFTVCWCMMFLQMLYMILHMFTDEPGGVDYRFQSMGKGYATVASCLHRFSIDTNFDESRGGDSKEPHGDDCDKEGVDDGARGGGGASKEPHGDDCDKEGVDDGARGGRKKGFVYWHTDILRVLAIYGRMPALVLNNMDLLAARLKRERDRVRYLQILFKRLMDNFYRVILIDIFELAFKLEIQVTILSIELALNPASLESSAALQMCFGIALSLFNVLLKMAQNIQEWRSFHSLHASVDHDTHCQRNLQAIRRTLWLYLAAIVSLGIFIVHSIVKLKMAFTCEFSMWNLNGCVEFEAVESADGSRMLVFD